MDLQTAADILHIQPDEIFYCLPTDLPVCLRQSNTTQPGAVVVTETELLYLAEETVQKRLSLQSIEAFEAEKQVGAANFNITVDGINQLFCRFTMKHFEEFAELAKALTYHIQNPDFPALDITKVVCPQCHMPVLNNQSCPRCEKKAGLYFRFLTMFKQFYPAMAITLFSTLFAQTLWIVLPYFQKVLVDDYITPNIVNAGGYFLIVGLMVLTHLLITASHWVNAKYANQVSNGIGRALRAKVFAKVQSLSMETISQKTAGELINRISSDTEKVQNFISDFGPETILRIFSFLTLSVILFITNWQLALMILLPLPFVFWLVSKIQNKIHVLFLNFWRKEAKANSILHDILSGIRVVKTFGSENREIEKYREVSENYTQAQIRAELYWASRFPIVEFFITIGYYFMLYFGGKMVLGQSLSVGQLIQFGTYVSMIYIPIRWIMYIRRNLADISVSMSKIFELLDEKSELTDIENPVEVAIQGKVDVEHVYFGYKKYENVLSDISFSVQPGEMIGIVGHSGVGKSTLINLIMHLYNPTQGRILIDGNDMQEISQSSLRRQMGVVLQETFLFYGSIFENIRYSKPEATLEEVITAAKIANAHKFIIKLPNGYNTIVGDKGYTLSGGERQRVAIARAILHNPSILILDEATASLDTQTEKEIQQALKRLIAGRTTFAIAHRLSTLQDADRLIVLDKGGVAEIGTHIELMQNKSVYYNLVMAQRQTSKIKQSQAG